MSEAAAAVAAEPAEKPAAEVPAADAVAAGNLLKGLDNCKLVSEADDGVRTWECASFCGRPCLIQQLPGAPHKHPVLNRKLTGSRLQQAVRGLCKARKLGVRAPVVFHADPASCCMYTALPAGTSLQQLLAEQALDDAGLDAVMTQLAQAVALLHDGGFVHASLAPSNIFWHNGTKQLELCGFGSSFNSTYPDDKAADLFILDAALQQQQPAALFDRFMAAYKLASRQWSATFNKLADVRKRAKKQQQPASLQQAASHKQSTKQGDDTS